MGLKVTVIKFVGTHHMVIEKPKQNSQKLQYSQLDLI